MKTEFPDITNLRTTELSGDPISSDAAQIAWMAALFEGEGYVAIPRSRKDRGGRHTSPLRVRFKMCDRDVLERFRNYAHGGNLTGPHAPSGLGKKQTYSLAIQGTRAFTLLKEFWPWLSRRRQQQVSVAINKWGEMRPSTDGRVLRLADAIEIKKQLAIGSHGIGRILAQKYGVTDGMISNIKNGRAWV